MKEMKYGIPRSNDQGRRYDYLGYHHYRFHFASALHCHPLVFPHHLHPNFLLLHFVHLHFFSRSLSSDHFSFHYHHFHFDSFPCHCLYLKVLDQCGDRPSTEHRTLVSDCKSERSRRTYIVLESLLTVIDSQN